MVPGSLGDGTTTDSKTPVQVSGISGVTAIACGGQHTIALKTDGTVWAWGDNEYGQLGDGTNIDSTTPVQVSNFNVYYTATGKIGVYVVNIKGKPIKSVRVSLKSETYFNRTLTDDDGYFEFGSLEADTYSITAQKKGYKKARKTVTLEDDEEAEIKIKMKEK